MGSFTIRMDEGRKERVFKFKKLYEKVKGEAGLSQARVYDLALDIANKKLQQIIEDNDKLGV